MEFHINFWKKPALVLSGILQHSSTGPSAWGKFLMNGKTPLYVSPIYKGGHKDRRNPTNYRPVSLTSCVARTMEKLLHCQVLKYLQTNGLLYEHQARFLPNHSTVTQLCFLTHKWQMTLDKGHHVQTAFLDLSNAYDRVSIPGLLLKLSDLGFSGETLRWFSSFLTNRQQCVRVNGSSSDTQCLISGIPQGTVLGPLLTCQNRWRTIVPYLLTIRQRTRPGKTSQQPPWLCPLTSLQLHPGLIFGVCCWMRKKANI